MSKEYLGNNNNRDCNCGADLELLFQSLAFVTRVGRETGCSTEAAQHKVQELIRNVSKNNGGNPMSDNGVATSGQTEVTL